MSGFAFAALAVTSALSALFSNRVSSRLGYKNALAAATLCAGAAYIPVAAAQNELSLILLFAFVGLFSGAMVPTANVLIDGWAPPQRQAAAFGLAGSALALAIAVAPLSGGAVAAAAGTEASFIVIGCVLLIVGLGVIAFVREPEERPEPELVTAEAVE
jgi:MFS family permease